MTCPFCSPEREFIAANVGAIAIYDEFPVSDGHALVVPRRHVPSVFDLDDDDYQACFNLVREVRDILDGLHGTAAFNVGINCGKTAGQTIDHAHIERSFVWRRRKSQIPDLSSHQDNIPFWDNFVPGLLECWSSTRPAPQCPKLSTRTVINTFALS